MHYLDIDSVRSKPTMPEQCSEHSNRNVQYNSVYMYSVE